MSDAGKSPGCYKLCMIFRCWKHGNMMPDLPNSPSCKQDAGNDEQPARLIKWPCLRVLHKKSTKPINGPDYQLDANKQIVLCLERCHISCNNTTFYPFNEPQRSARQLVSLHPF